MAEDTNNEAVDTSGWSTAGKGGKALPSKSTASAGDGEASSTTTPASNTHSARVKSKFANTICLIANSALKSVNVYDAIISTITADNAKMIKSIYQVGSSKGWFVSFKHHFDASKIVGKHARCVAADGKEESIELLDPNAALAGEKGLSGSSLRNISRSVTNQYLVRFLWLPEHVTNQSIRSQLLALKLKSLSVVSISMEHYPIVDNKMHGI